jgi:hypothetical protein
MPDPNPAIATYHIRRCHVCGHVTELANSAVHKCGHCGKHLAPFYYFDESKLDGLLEQGPYLSIWKTSTLLPGTFNPIWGLSTYWQESYESQSRGYSSSA